MLEVEFKFQVTSRQVFDRIRSRKQVAGYKLADQKIDRQRDIYLDTATCTLFRQGASLRLRETEGVYWITFKTQIEGVEVRTELKNSLTDAQAQAVLDGNLAKIRVEAAQAAATYLNREKIYSVLHIVKHREAWYIHAEGSRVQICFDTVRHTTTDQRQSIEECELELELKAGGRPFLREIAQALSRQYGLRATHQSKYDRGVALLNVFATARR